MSQIASFSGGKTPSTSKREYWGNDVLWVTSKDMKTKYIESSLMMLSLHGAATMQLYPANTLLMVTRSGILRHTLPIAILNKEATVNQDIKAVSLVLPELAEYIYCCLKGMEPRLLKQYVKSGVTVENINFDKFQNALLPIAPFDEMRRILSISEMALRYVNNVEYNKSELTEIIAVTKSRILDLAIRGKLVPQDPNDEPASVRLERIRAEKEELIKQGKIKRDKKESVIFKGLDNFYYEQIGEQVICIDDEIPFEIPDGWRWCRLGSLFCHNTGKALNAAVTSGKMLTYITTSNVYWDSFELTNLKSMPFSDDEIEKCTVEKGDLLVCEGGDIGRAAVWNYDEPMRIQNHLHRLRAYGNLNPYFYQNVFCLYKSIGKIKGNGIGLQTLSSSQLHGILVPLLSIDEQERIVEKIHEIFSYIDSIEASLN